MKKNRTVCVAMAVMVVVLLVSIPLDLASQLLTWTYPSFEITPMSDVLGNEFMMGPMLVRLCMRLACAVVIALALMGVLVACRGHKNREDAILACLACLACTAAVLVRLAPMDMIDNVLLRVARMVVVACYAPLCYVVARMLGHRMRGRPALAACLCVHVALVVSCAWSGSRQDLWISVPTVAWMSLCWTLFAAPTLLSESFGARTGASKVVSSTLLFVVQVGALSLARLAEIVRSLGLPASPHPGCLSFNWLVEHTNALVAVPQATYAEHVADLFMLERMRRLPLAWLGVSYGPMYRLAYAVLLLLFVAASFALWRDACDSGKGELVKVLALGVLLSNLWGAACSVFLFTSTGVVTLLSGNPFQLVPVICLLMLEIKSWRVGTVISPPCLPSMH